MNKRTVPLVERYKGGPFCDYCGEQIRWCRLRGGSYIAVDLEPILYMPGAGREWLVADAEIKKDCRIWRPGMPPSEKIRRGYRPHAWNCWANQ